MPLVLIATPKATDANSYLTVTEADAYFLGRLNAAKWTSADATAKALALVAATSRLEHEEYLGQATNPDQRLKWPRYGIEGDRASFYDSDTIPRLVKEAVCELALVLLLDGTTDRWLDSGLESFTSVTVGPLSIDLDASYAAGTLPMAVARMLGVFRSGGNGTVRLVHS